MDTFCTAIRETPEHLLPFVLSPILSQASKHANTSGVFKGFYKNKEGIGQFGGTFKNALPRILREIEICEPVLSRVKCEARVYQEDANHLIKNLEPVDVAYFDPPYNQHPYGSNYFMLNLISDYQRPDDISTVSGIPSAWNRSPYNKRQQAAGSLFEAVRRVEAKFVLISYNSEGFIKPAEFLRELTSIGALSIMDTQYNTFRGCRNLADRDAYVTESLYLLDKR